MGHGGQRPGAGRPKGTPDPHTRTKQAQQDRARTQIYAEQDAIIAALIAQAKGTRYLVVRNKKTGQFVRIGKRRAERLKPDEELIEIWEKDPSAAAAKDLLDRALDKPTEHVEMEATGTWEARVALLTAARERDAAYDAKQKGGK